MAPGSLLLLLLLSPLLQGSAGRPAPLRAPRHSDGTFTSELSRLRESARLQRLLQGLVGKRSEQDAENSTSWTGSAPEPAEPHREGAGLFPGQAVCSVDKTFFEIQENTEPSGPLVDINIPEGQQVTLGPSSTPFAFRIQGSQLFLNVTPDYEENTILQAHLECRRGDTVVTQLRVFVSVLDVNDNPPVFPFEVKVERVPEDTKVNSTVIPEEELEAQDRDKDNVLFYTLQEVTPGAKSFFSLVGANRPALRLDRPLDFDKWPHMTFQLLVRDTREENAVPSHTDNATLVLEVQPADRRPPWFLPCIYSDNYVCVHAEYHGAIPTGHKLLGPLILQPGPIYAVDGDRGINQRIIYSFLKGNEEGNFVINADSGNLTMTRSIPSPKTFVFLVKGEQADLASYSVTKVRVEARNASGSPPRFPLTLYRGTVAPGSGVGVAVKDAAVPSQLLRIRAQDPDFPDLNSAITYKITNNSNFRMNGETVLTAAPLALAGIFYAEVQANNTVTSGTASTVMEIQVSEQEPTTPTGPPVPPTAPEAGGTTRPSTSTTSEAPSPPGPTQGSSTTSSEGGTGPRPTPGTTLRPPASSTPGGPPSAGTSTSPPSASPSGGSTQTPKPGTSRPTSLESSRTPQLPGSPGTGGVTGGIDQPGGSHAEDQRFSQAEMGALGGVLGGLLLLALLALLILIHKHYGPQLPCCSGKALEPSGFDNKAFLPDHEANWAPAPSPAPDCTLPADPPASQFPEPPAPPSPPRPGRVPESPATARDGGGPEGVRSILTKERRPESGYKAVWFGEDIGAEADVVVLNTPASDADGAGDSGSEGSGDEDADADVGGGPHDEVPSADSTYM